MKDSDTALRILIEECISSPEKRKKFIKEGTVELLLSKYTFFCLLRVSPYRQIIVTVKY